MFHKNVSHKALHAFKNLAKGPCNSMIINENYGSAVGIVP